MIERKIESLKDFRLITYFGTHFLSEGEVKRIRFKNKKTFEAQIIAGNIKEADLRQPEVKKIPVVLPLITEDTVVSVEPEELKADEKPVEQELAGLPKVEVDLEEEPEAPAFEPQSESVLEGKALREDAEVEPAPETQVRLEEDQSTPYDEDQAPVVEEAHFPEVQAEQSEANEGIALQ